MSWGSDARTQKLGCRKLRQDIVLQSIAVHGLVEDIDSLTGSTGEFANLHKIHDIRIHRTSRAVRLSAVPMACRVSIAEMDLHSARHA